MRIISPLTFIDKLVKKNELGRPEVLRLAFAFDEDGRLPWDTIIYSCVKTRSTAPILKTYAHLKFSQRWIF
jgi:hypothetical protein